MIDLFIFYTNILVAIYAFTKNWQNSSMRDGFLSVGLIALIFAIGWALTGSLAYAIWPKKWDSIYFTYNTLSLVLLFIPEIFFFYHFFFANPKKNATGTDK